MKEVEHQKTTERILTIHDSLGPNPTIEKNIPDDVDWIDDAFYIKETRFGMYTSILKEPFGAHFITSLRHEGCLKMTRSHLKCLQEGTLQDYTHTVNTTSGVEL